MQKQPLTAPSEFHMKLLDMRTDTMLSNPLSAPTPNWEFLGRLIRSRGGSLRREGSEVLKEEERTNIYSFFSLCSFSSTQFSRSVMSDSLWPHESQHARPPCPSPTPRVYSNSRPSSWWCHPAISSSVVPFSSCPQSLPASGSFPMSQLFTWGG